MGRNPRQSSSPDRLQIVFKGIRSFVATRWPAARFVRIVVGCPEIEAFRESHPGKVGDRNFMHVGHRQGVVCVSPRCENLHDQILTGLFLHEFGHLGSGGGELEADRWVYEKFGIRITYEGELDLECVNEFAMKRVIATVKKVGVDLRHNR